MATILENDLISVRFCTLAEGQLGENVRVFVCTNVIGTISDFDVSDYFDTMMAPLYKPFMGSQASWFGVGARILRIPTIVEATSKANQGPGTGGATLVPTQAAGLVTFRTPNAGRAFRGRMYLPFLATAMLTTDGNATVAAVTLMQAVGTAIRQTNTVTNVGGNSVKLNSVLYHRATRTTTLITSATAQAAIATMRKRGAYGRLNAPPF